MLYIDSENCVVKDIFECGQVFRFERFEHGYSIISQDKMAVVCDHAITSSDDVYFHNYFDLSTDYQIIMEKLKVNALLDSAITYGRGIRILQQDHFETLISFIISANNHIPRIRSIIERMASTLGERKQFEGREYFAFPTPEAIATCSLEQLQGLGLGYRSNYVLQTAKRIVDGFDLKTIATLSTESARKELCSFLGVGTKVADCVLLFAYKRLDCFPVDTWMEKVYYDYFDNKRLSAKDISKYFVDKFGNLSGYAQQYLFYYKKNLEEN